MWFADIICDYAWFESTQGNLGEPRIMQAIPSCVDGVSITLCLYGTESEIMHARVLMNVNDKEEAHRVSNESVGYWVSILAVTGGLILGRPIEPEILPDSSAYAVVFGEGDERTVSLSIARRIQPKKIDLSALSNCIANWRPEGYAHLFYMGNFLNKSLPTEVRWLNGYRLAEWHFQRNKVGLCSNKQWRELLEKFRADFAPHLRADQTLHGFIEETRALAAHAILDSRSVGNRTEKPGNQILWSFRIIESIVAYIGNLEEINRGLVTLRAGV